MKKILALLLALSMLLCLAACGEEEPDPNAGLYEGRSASYGGLSIGIETVFDEFALELKNGGKASFHYDGKSYSMKWTLDGETFHAEGGGAELDGTLGGGVMVLQNVLDSGIDITLVCDALAAAAPGATAAEPAAAPAETEAEPAAAAPVETEAEPAAAAPAETAAEPEQEDGSIDPSFLFGQWRHEYGYVYTFNEDCSGSYGRNGEEMAFTYEVTEEELRIRYEDSSAPLVLGYRVEGVLLTIVDSLGHDVYYDKIIPEPVLEALALLPVFDARQATDMSNWVTNNQDCIIADDVFYGSYFVTGGGRPVFCRMELERYGSGVARVGWGVLDEENSALYVQKRDDLLYYVMLDRESGERAGVACVRSDGSDRRVLYEGGCSDLCLRGERLYFTDDFCRLVSTDLDGGDLQLLLDKEIYYAYMLDEDWLLYQDDADSESLHLYCLSAQTDIKLNDEPSYSPILIGDKLFFTVRDEAVDGAKHLCRIDLSQWEKVYDGELGCHVPRFAAERSELLLGGTYSTDGTILVPANNYNGATLASWRDLEDDSYLALERFVGFFSEDYEIDFVYDEEGYVDRVMFFDRASGYGDAISWLP